ncbi:MULTISPECIES: GntR family transcriptional regulator [unclassified Chelatococcus]|uniref:GntR family transcriptional regulator n=1 Tax=unclassified Chelatococcus TaxID=2638111 RepID=UPI001BCFF8E9|nr:MULTISPECIES: GntR family transcriptional regulator [unclassified Chelatococcus]MBS7700362.1 GntR family transcriptional regulator [Chelatococcus sp. YT9]MBX3556158.1 GntR family transcriptional regulator [Chelatococcus sp.]
MQIDKNAVLSKLRSDIVAGEFESGARLRIDELATRYGVSPMPIREALHHLNGEGLIVITHNRGARVRHIDARLVENLFDIRISLETMLTRRGAERRTSQDVKAMIAEQERFEGFIAAGDNIAVLQSNRAFHKIIHEAADNEEALSLADRHWFLVATLWQRFGYRQERFAGVISDHRQLIAAVETRDGAAAAAIMQAHVIKAKLELLAILREQEKSA